MDENFIFDGFRRFKSDNSIARGGSYRRVMEYPAPVT